MSKLDEFYLFEVTKLACADKIEKGNGMIQAVYSEDESVRLLQKKLLKLKRKMKKLYKENSHLKNQVEILHKGMALIKMTKGDSNSYNILQIASEYLEKYYEAMAIQALGKEADHD